MSPPDTGSLFIGVDIGTSSVKALMAGPGGVRIAGFSADHETERPAPGASEQDPGTWMRHVETALARFAEHPRAGDVAAIGVTSQVNTHVFCDEDGRALRPALTWQDTRSAGQAARLESAIDPDVKSRALGAPIPIDASHALARMAWLADTDAEAWKATAHVMLPRDFIIAGLTGACVADPISAVGLVSPDLAYAAPVLELVRGAIGLLPPLRDPLDIAGKVRGGRPFAGVPVATGTMDAWAGMFGLGVATEGQAMYLSGTSEVLGLISHRRAGAPGVITFPDWRGITLHAGPTQSGGASLRWLSAVLGQDVATLGKLAEKVSITAQSPLFLPHLDGERAPLWDPTSRGVFAGMTSATGPAELAAAVMEGVAFSARLALEAIEESGARSVGTLRHGGGGAQSDAWCAIRANALGRNLERVTAPETGALGALVMAAVASGHIDDLAAATGELVATDRVFVPDPAATGLADQRYGAFRDLYAALGPVNAQLAGAASSA